MPPLGNSDHACIDVTLLPRKVSRDANQSKAYRKVWKYAQADFDEANELLNISNTDVCPEDDIEQAWSKWEKYFVCNASMHSQSDCESQQKSPLANS